MNAATAAQPTSAETPIPYLASTLEQWAGRDLGRSDWVCIEQQRIDRFADCTGDHQWIHVDVPRALRDSPFGGPVAHGYLTLSLLAPLAMQIGVVPRDARAVFNYGLDRVRFMAPVKAGARVRAHVKIGEVRRIDDGRKLVRLLNTLEIEGSAKPALVAETMLMVLE